MSNITEQYVSVAKYCDEIYAEDSTVFDTYSFLCRIVHKDQTLVLEEVKRKLEILCKKIDVSKRVYDYYTSDGKPLSNAKPIVSQMEITLCFLLLDLTKSKKDVMYLNSACKLLDNSLGTGTKYPQAYYEIASKKLETLCNTLI